MRLLKTILAALALALFAGFIGDDALGGHSTSAMGGSLESFGGDYDESTAAVPPASYACRLDPSGISTGAITTWTANALSTKGSECNVTQSGASTLKPTYVASCAEFGGSPCADFDGGDALRGSTFSSAVAYPASICFAVVHSNSSLGVIFADSNAVYGHLTYNAAGSLSYYHPVPGNDTFTSSAHAPDTGDSLCVAFDGTGQATLLINGAVNAGPLGAHTGSFAALGIAETYLSGSRVNGRYAEVVLYDRDITSEIDDWYTYTCSAYGLQC